MKRNKWSKQNGKAFGRSANTPPQSKRMDYSHNQKTILTNHEKNELQAFKEKANQDLSNLMKEINALEKERAQDCRNDQIVGPPKNSFTSLADVTKLAEKLHMVMTEWNDDSHTANAIYALEEHANRLSMDPMVLETNYKESVVTNAKQSEDKYKDRILVDMPQSPGCSELLQICDSLMAEKEDLLQDIVKLKDSYEEVNKAECDAVIAKSNRKMTKLEIETSLKQKRMFISFCSMLRKERCKNAKMRAFMKWKIWVLSQSNRK